MKTIPEKKNDIDKLKIENLKSITNLSQSDYDLQDMDYEEAII